MRPFPLLQSWPLKVGHSRGKKEKGFVYYLCLAPALSCFVGKRRQGPIPQRFAQETTEHLFKASFTSVVQLTVRGGLLC